jgi:O-antigen ligase
MILTNSLAAPDYITDDSNWMGLLHRINLGLFCLMPALLLFWRGGADAAATIISVSFVAVVIARRQWPLLRWPLLAVILGIWLLLILVISPLALQPALSFSRSLVWLRLPLVAIAVCLWLVRSPQDLKTVMIAWAAALGMAMIDGMVQLITGQTLGGRPIWEESRLTGPLDRPNIGMFVARIGFPLAAAVALLMVQNRPPMITRLILALIGFFAMVFIFLTGERAASGLSLISVFFVVSLIVLIVPRYRLYGILAILCSGAALVAVAASSERILRRVTATMEVIGDIGASHYGEIFYASLRVWLEHPVTGVGMKNFQDACTALTQATMRYPCPQHPHNIYLEWLVETGVIGAAAYIALVVLLFALLLPLLRQAQIKLVGACCLGALVLLQFPLTPTQSAFSNWPALLAWSSLALVLAVSRLALRNDPR